MIVKEHIDFKRGEDSKKALDVGEYRSENQTIRRYLEPTYPDFIPDAFDWLSKNPEMMKDLGVSKEGDIKDLVSMESEYTMEMNPDLTPEHLELDFDGDYMQIYKEPGKYGATWYWTVGKLGDGSKAIQYRTGLTDGFISRKEWLK